jgi:hypothetical protein
MRNSVSRSHATTASRPAYANFALLSALGLAIGAFLAATNPALSEESKVLNFSDFSKVDISESIDGIILQSDAFEVRATAKDQTLLDSVIVEKSGDTLKIHRKDMGLLKSLTTMFNSPSPKVYIHLPQLDAATASAGADLNIEALSVESLDLSVSSGADITAMQLTVNSINGNSSSGADLQLGGTCTDGNLSVSSGADIEADSLKCMSVKVDASSGGDAAVYASEQLSANASSGADIEVHGEANQMSISTSSGGEVNTK